MKKESEKVGFKLNIHKTKIMASGSIMPWQTDGEIMDTVTGFIFLGSEITSDGDCSHEIKRYLLLRGKAMISLDSILKSRDITLLTESTWSTLWFFSVVMYGCESYNIKKTEQLSTEVLLLLNCGVGKNS